MNRVDMETTTRKYSWVSDDKKLQAEMTIQYHSAWPQAKHAKFEMVSKGGFIVADITLNLNGGPLTLAQESALFDDLIGTVLVYYAGGGIVPD